MTDRAKAWRALLLALLVALAVAIPGLACGDSGDGGPPTPLSDGRAEALVKQLRSRGHVLLLRHAATDNAVDTTADFMDCSRQRNLSSEGRRQARAIGRALRKLRVPVGQTMASPFCRTRDTARLVTGNDFTSRALLPPDLLETVRTESDSPSYNLRGQLGNYVDTASNVVFVSHESTILEATGLRLREGETAVVAPSDNERGYRVAARLMPRDWTWLASR
jgi:phosphohistidine phosphatase SixA